MSESAVFASVLSSREAYDRVYNHIDLDELSPQAKVWWPLVKEWYKLDPRAKWVDRASLRERGQRVLPDKHVDTLVGWFDGLPGHDEVSPGNVVSDLLDSKRFVKGNQLCMAIQGGDIQKIEPILGVYRDLLVANQLGTSNIEIVTLEDMMEITNRDNLIGLAPKSLNDKCKGGAAPGDHILIFGRTEAGKTLFAVNLTAGFLKFDHEVLYLANEENPGKTMARIVCNLANATADQYNEEKARAIGVAREKGLDNLTVVKMEPGTLAEVEDLIRTYRPKVVVLDQIRNMYFPGSQGGSMVTKLEQLGMGFRTLLAKYGCVGVSITQARDTESPDPWLRVEHIDNSRTGLPGTADLIIGIGVDDGLVASGQRAISLCKNKLNDEPNGKIGFIVQTDTSRSRVR